MVKVVPLIVMGYAIQCYVINQMNTPIGTLSLMFLGFCLVSLIMGFVIYDTKHQVEFFEDKFEINFLGNKTVVFYSEIVSIEHAVSSSSFSRLTIVCRNQKFKFYFVDEADKLKAFVEEKKTPLSKAA